MLGDLQSPLQVRERDGALLRRAFKQQGWRGGLVRLKARVGVRVRVTGMVWIRVGALAW